MSNTINVNYMTGMVNSLAKSVSPKTAPSATFGEMLASTGTQVTDMVAISAAGTAEAVSRDDITMEEYKKSTHLCREYLRSSDMDSYELMKQIAKNSVAIRPRGPVKIYAQNYLQAPAE